jgi:hypothetical protein
MRPLSRRVLPSVHTERQPPVALFKTSLRDWQVRYQVLHAAQARVLEKVPSQAAPA